MALLILSIFLLTWQMGAWTGPLKGDDVFFHAANVRFVAQYFPDIWWFPSAHAGEPLLLSYPITPYLLMASLLRMGVPAEAVLRLFLAGSILGIGLLLFLLARGLRLGRVLSLGLALLPFTSHAFWSWSLVGGAYQRVAAVTFLMLAVWGCYQYIASSQVDGAARGGYVPLLAGLVLTALTHALVFQFAIVLVALLLLFGLEEWRQRLAAIAKSFLPVAALVAWQYVPLVVNVLARDRAVGGAVRHDVTTMRLEWLFGLPHTRDYSLGPGPILFMLAVAGLAYVSFAWSRAAELRKTSRAHFALLMASGILSIYFVAFAWIHMPASLYLMAAYDYAIWSSITLTLFAAAFVALVIRELPVSPKWLGGTFTAIVAVGAVAVIPWVRAFSLSPDPRDLATFSHAAAQAIDLGLSVMEPGHRLGVVDRTATRSLSYFSPEVEYLGGRSGASPNRYFYEWMVSDVYYRLDRDTLRFVYFEDRPRVLRHVGPLDNFFPAMFWMDWYGADTAVLDLPFYPNQRTASGYAARPHIFDYRTAETRFGEVAAVSYPSASPVTALTIAPPVAVPYTEDARGSFYTDLLEILASLRLDSRTLIPIKLSAAEGLQSFDRVLVDYSTYLDRQSLFDRYTAQGGHLAVVGFRHSPVTPREVTFGRGLSLTADSAVLEGNGTTSAFASSKDGPIGACSPSGSGQRCTLGISLSALRATGSGVAAVLVLEALHIGDSMKTTIPVDDPYLSYTLPGTPAALVTREGGVRTPSVKAEDWVVTYLGERDSAVVDVSSQRVLLRARFQRDEVDLNQVNLTAFLEETVAMDSASVVSFELRAAAGFGLTLSFERRQAFNVFRVHPDPGSWARYTIPVAAFRPAVGSVRKTARLAFSILPSQGNLSGTVQKTSLRVRDFEIVEPSRAAATPFLQIGSQSGLPQNQANLAVSLDEPVPAAARGMIIFRLWSAGTLLRNFAVTLIDSDAEGEGFLHYILPQARWTGERTFSLPLGAFGRKGVWNRSEFDRIEFVFNVGQADLPSNEPVHAFRVTKVRVATLKEDDEPAGVYGIWERPNSYEVFLPSDSSATGLLWKENYVSEWRVSIGGRDLPFYFAGPGMIYVPLDGVSDSVLFEMPVPTSVIVGAATSAVSSLALVAWWWVRRARKRPGARARSN